MGMEKLSKTEILGLANELHFTLNDQEIVEVMDEFDVLMQQLALLESQDTTNVEEFVYPLNSMVTIMREDIADHVLSVESVLRNAPKKKNNFVVVPKVVG
jgi:aspartyl-tRNA(Asn)/glutamyl-tRNA(Gln) amidotransferase subunit C